jgi:HK97 gp10 family phage protein
MAFEMTGVQEMVAKLRGLGQEMSAAGTRRAVLAGGRVIKDAMIEAAPVLDKRTQNSTSLEPLAVKENIRVYIPEGEVPIEALIGPGVKTGYVVRWLEYGHRMVEHSSLVALPNGKTRNSGGRASLTDVEPHPFVRAAFESSVAAAQEAMAASVAATIDKVTAGKAV